jgi:small subunit ribosomal protein S12
MYKKKNKTPALQHCPQKRGTCLKPLIITPKKPHSAKRKVAKIRLSNKKIIVAYIPGIGHTIKEYTSLLIRGGRERDLPAVKYHIIRGKYDVTPVLRYSARSKYGTRRAILNYTN